jgi:subtilisin family serine protease
VQPERLPHLRIERYARAPFRSPRGGGGGEQQLPERNPPAHSARLLENLDQLVGQLRARDEAVARAPEAQGHLVSAQAQEGSTLAAESLADQRAEITLVAEGKDSALLHLRRDDVTPIRRKIVAYGDEARRTASGRPRNEPLVAPLEGFRPATLADLSEGSLTEANVEHGVIYWVELWMRGGSLEGEDVRERVRRDIDWLAERVGVAPETVRPFRATERDVYLLPLPGEVLHQLPVLLPEAYRVVEATAGLRDWIVSELEAELVLPDQIDAPDENASCVVVIDTGVAPEHPLLAPALTSRGTSVIVDDPSPVDTDGHGTEMAGLAAYDDLGEQLIGAGRPKARVRLSNVRLIPEDQDNADEREFWPERTEQAVVAAETEGEANRIFNLSVGADNPRDGDRTSWSVGLDLLAHNESAGRLFCVAAGNVGVSSQRDDYPALNLVSFLDDPAQAMNVITVGAVTERVALPNDALHQALTPLAEENQLSPFSRTGLPVAAIKPDVVFEGGNCAPDGALPNWGISSLSVLTTDHRHAAGRLLTYSWATSAACASVSGLLGDIWNATQVEQPATVRALLVHSARWTQELRDQFPDQRELLRAAGYGVPSRDLASYSFRTRPTLLVEDQLRPATPTGDGRVEREVHFIRLPLPSASLVALGEQEVELCVTLSFFVEPNEANRRHYAGAMLRWDVQRPTESAEDFRRRVNRLERAPGFEASTDPYPWDIGIDTRSRGSVQSDRCRLPAALLAGEKMIAVYPAIGWWDGRPQREDAAVPYSLVVSIDAGNADIDLYAEIEAAIEVPVEIA